MLIKGQFELMLSPCMGANTVFPRDCKEFLRKSKGVGHCVSGRYSEVESGS